MPIIPANREAELPTDPTDHKIKVSPGPQQFSKTVSQNFKNLKGIGL